MNDLQMACPSEETVASYVANDISTSQRSHLLAHFGDCESCRRAVSMLAVPLDAEDHSHRGARHSHAASPESGTDASHVTAEPPEGELPPGTKLGRYILLHLIGAGAMGQVYAAHDPELERTVALKLLHPQRAGGEETARMLLEARAMAKLRHPNVVAVHDIGETAGRIYLAMEYVPGVSLREWIANKPRTRDEILDVFRQAGAGLAAAHAMGIIHRDFKPDNVFLGDDDRVRVGDFGLAWPRDSAQRSTASSFSGADVDVQLTRTGEVVGTPAYLAPESFQGDVATERSDQFAFCVALFEALCGYRPFGGQTYSVLGAKVISGERKPLRAKVRVPRRIRAALARGLAVEPERRFADMNQLLEQLRIASSRTRALAVAAVAITTLSATTWWALQAPAPSE